MSNTTFAQFFDAPGFLCVRRPILRWNGPSKPYRVAGYNNLLVFDHEEFTVHADIPRTGAFKLVFFPKETYVYRKQEHRNISTVYANSRGIHSVTQRRMSNKNAGNFTATQLVNNSALAIGTIKDYSFNIDKKMLTKFLSKLDETSKPCLSDSYVNTVRSIMEQIISLPT